MARWARVRALKLYSKARDMTSGNAVAQSNDRKLRENSFCSIGNKLRQEICQRRGTVFGREKKLVGKQSGKERSSQ